MSQLYFDNLPLKEVVVRLSLREPLPITFPAISELSKLFKDREDFVQTEELNALEQPPGLPITFEMRLGQLPGVRFIGNRHGLSLALQPTLIAMRWIHGPDDPEYPHFPVVRKTLEHVLLDVSAVLATGSAATNVPNVAVVNMAYLNVISPADKKTVLKDYFTDVVEVDILSEAMEVSEVDLNWRTMDGIDLRFELLKVTPKKGSPSPEGYRLGTAAGLTVPNAADPLAMLDRIHSQLQDLFLKVISAKAKSEWKYRRGSD